MFEITADQLDDLVDRAEVALDVRADYSGRAMYGRTCVGLVGSIGDFAGFMIELGRRVAVDDDAGVEYDELAQAIQSDVRTDSMGLSTIFYFPQVRRANEPNEADEPDPDAERDRALDVELGIG